MGRINFMWGRIVALPAATVLAMAAGPPRTFDLQYRSDRAVLAAPSTPVVARPGNAFIAAPTPNRDILAPTGPTSEAPSVAPGLFTRSTQNRGEGFLQGSTAQSGQDRRAAPGAGFNLKMPLHQ